MKEYKYLKALVSGRGLNAVERELAKKELDELFKSDDRVIMLNEATGVQGYFLRETKGNWIQI